MVCPFTKVNFIHDICIIGNNYTVYVSIGTGLLTILSHTRKILQTVIFHFLSTPRYGYLAFELT